MVIKMKRSKFRILLILCLFLSSLLILSIGPNFPYNIVRSDDKIVLPIIMYHEVKNYKLGKDVISPAEFEADLNYLKNNHFTTITMTQLIDYVVSDIPLPNNPIILTFDDGYLNNYHYVFPLLKQYNMQIVFSVIGKNIDDFTRIPDSSLDYSHVTWKQLKEMIDSDHVEVQNHSYNLHRYDKSQIVFLQKKEESLSQYEKRLTDDILPFQEQLALNVGKTPNTFTYPYGIFSKNSDYVLKNLGFQATLSCKYGINFISKDPGKLYGLKRICRSHGNSLEKVLKVAYKAFKI